MRPVERLRIELGMKPITFYNFNNECVRCTKQIETSIMTQREIREIRLSGFCKSCQDHVFDRKPDPPGINSARFDWEIRKMKEHFKKNH